MRNLDRPNPPFALGLGGRRTQPANVGPNLESKESRMTAAAALTTTETRLRALLIEDDPLVREVLAAALAGAGYEVRAEVDGTGVERAVSNFLPDIALIDLHLGDGVNGITVARRIRATREVPFLFITGANTIEDVLSAFEVGSDDYVIKPFAMAELLARMRAVLRRWGRVERSVLTVGDLVVDLEAHRAVRSGEIIELTHREFSLLATLARHPGIVLSKVQLLTQVWGFEHYDLNLVEVHISAMRRKMEEHGRRLIHTVRGVGYVLRADASGHHATEGQEG
jgi:two-component system OmpR family response regulator